ncbi:MAG: heme exporter protein CcmD [Halieaceae bacterium]|nr:heme exporter protein CcmD [Halieaceae bacterium]
MYFENFQALLTMDGHGGYVWSVYLLTLLVLASLALTPLLRDRRFFKEQLMYQRRQQQQKTAVEHSLV